MFTLRSSTRPADVIIDASGLQAPALHLIEFTDPCTFEGLTFKGGVGALITPGNYLARVLPDAIFTKCVFFGNAADQGGPSLPTSPLVTSESTIASSATTRRWRVVQRLWFA